MEEIIVHPTLGGGQQHMTAATTLILTLIRCAMDKTQVTLIHAAMVGPTISVSFNPAFVFKHIS